MRPVVALAVLVFVVALAGCGAEPPPPPPPPVTVTAVDAVQNLTLSDGRRVYNTRIAALDHGDTPRARCENAYDEAAARRLLTGQTVAAIDWHSRWDGATPGYRPAELRFRTAERPYGDDLTRAWSDAQAGRAQACPNTEQAPLSGLEVADSPGGDVYVEHDGDGESRWCARRWWC